MKVASVLDIKQIDQNSFNFWLDTLPRKFSSTTRERLWLASNNCDTAMWTESEGFRFY